MSNKKSQYKGVHWKKRIQKWVAEITIDGHKTEIIRTEDERKAALAYDKIAIRVGYKPNILKKV